VYAMSCKRAVSPSFLEIFLKVRMTSYEDFEASPLFCLSRLRSECTRDTVSALASEPIMSRITPAAFNRPRNES
jgi:hypothetical protein